MYAGKRVFITGASSGIGEAIARELARQGAAVAMAARRTDRLEEVAREIAAAGGKAIAVACDVTRDGDMERAVADTVARLGGIDVAIANAGFGVAGELGELTVQDYRNQFETNFFGLLRTVYGTLPELKKNRGRLALVGSVNSWIALPGSSPYCTSKFAVRALAEALGPELRADGVSVTLIAPGFVHSEIRLVDNKGVLKPGAKDPVPAWLPMPAEKAARQIARAIGRRKHVAVITGHGKLAVFLSRHFPWLIRALISVAGISGRNEPG